MIKVYTDGGARPNPGPGGWGVVVVAAAGEVRELSGGELETTNNRMELTAAIEALDSQPEGSSFEVVTDSQYVRLGITDWIHKWSRNGWRRGQEAVKNVDLWKSLDALNRERSVRWHWVKGHAGNRYNERADELATAQIERLQGARKAKDAASAAERPAVVLEPPELELTVQVRFSDGNTCWGLFESRAGKETVVVEPSSAASAYRLELEAGLAAIDRVPTDVIAAIYCGDYLRKGATEWLPGWKRRGWRTASGSEVKNRDLWKRIEGALKKRRRLRLLPIDAKAAAAKRLKTALRGG